METIICAIAEDIDVEPELVERAVAEGFAEWVKCLVLTEKGDKMFTDKYLRETKIP